MKLKSKIFIGLVIVVATMLVGIPTRVLNRDVDSKTFDEIKDARKILSKTKEIVAKDPLDDIPFSPLVGDEFGYINTVEKIDKFFIFLNVDEKEKLKSLLRNSIVENIDVMRPHCIRFKLKESFKNYFITSSYERIELVYNDSCECPCQEMQMDEETADKVDLGDGWYKVSIITRRTKPHA